MNKYLKLDGTVQGLIKGSVNQKGREGLISVTSVSHEVTHVTDASGLPIGRAVHKPLLLVKSIDRSTPLLYRASDENEAMKTFSLAFYGKSGTGAESHIFSIDLSNARISAIAQVKLNSSSTPDQIKFAEYEEVYFTYESIQWTWKQVPNDISYQTFWDRPPV